MLSLNRQVLKQQKRNLVIAIIVLLLVFWSFILLIPKHAKKSADDKGLNLTGIVDESFDKSNRDSALVSQQTELESLKEQMQELKKIMQKKEKEEAGAISNLVLKKLKEAKEAEKQEALQTPKVSHPSSAWEAPLIKPTPKLHSVSFNYKPRLTLNPFNRLDAENFVPSGTFVRAVILGGADADASVNGQSKNNGVMLFKLLQPGTLPNGRHSHLQGCFVTASSYGDISSERAYVVLDRISCAFPNHPIIDKAVTGWAFFGGKVGIKGVPLMRDNKVMQWAGISGAMSGIASAAQYSQSIQSITPLGAASSVPSTNVAPYAAYGGASKAAEVLSNYYVKRAEQYHPVIQVGSGNVVTIVFKEGFFLEPDEALTSKTTNREQRLNESSEEVSDFTVPQQVLEKANVSRGVEP